ncbi:MAG TPA: hypothetical protein VHC97_21960 [Thermoanaerobaculia bacterium]|nr:hypothetical protein [Thermoanaerobaculia bacterium]
MIPKAFAVFVLASLLCGCGDRPPRRLPFPVFEARSPFPELADAQPGSPSESAFAQALGGTAGTEARKPPVQSVPLGNRLAGELPAESWTWSSDPGLTLAVHRGPGGTDALIYAEGFSPRMLSSPSAEISRFQRTIVPEGVDDLIDPRSLDGLRSGGLARRIARGSGMGMAEAARLAQLLRTRTAGRGLGFHPGPGGATGWRWVGRNGQGATLRLARVSGTWGRQRNLPAGLVRGLARLPQAAPELAGVAEWLARAPETGSAVPGGPAYLLIGSVTDEYEAAGAHLAILCAGIPRCPVAEDLAAFLGSIQIGDPGRLERLRDSQAAPADLAREEGIEILPRETALAPQP